MKIGFIGAGKMGFTLGRHISDYDRKCKEQGEDSMAQVVGYYSKNPDSAKDAAQFTDTEYFLDYVDMIGLCDTIFITVPDGEIAVMANELNRLGNLLDGKIICHTSGALSSQVFSSMDSQVYGYSIHPIYAVNSKYESYKQFYKCFITIEGHDRYISKIEKLFLMLGHKIKIIGSECKSKYHAACVFSSNLVVSLYDMGAKLLSDCGFDKDDAMEALMPLFVNNANNIEKYGCKKALTGPVSRGDTETVKKHVECMEGNVLSTYKLLSDNLIDMCLEDSEELTVKYENMKAIIGGNN